MSETILEQLGNRKISKTQLFKHTEADFSLVPVLLEGTKSPNAAVRYGCGSVLADLCKKHPKKLYPYFDGFVPLLDSKHRILTWNAMAAIAYLTAVDADKKFDNIFSKYYSFLESEYMVTVANVVGYSAVIATNKSYLAGKIVAELLKLQNLQITPHISKECKLVIAQKAIETFKTLIDYVQDKEALVAFAQKYQDSSRATLKREAQRFLEKLK